MSNLKRVGLVLAGLGMLMLGHFKPASAATTGDINVTVTVDVVSVSVASTTWAVGSVAPATISISSAIGVTNDGNRQEDYSLSLTYTPGWTISTDQTAASNEFVMLGLFTTTPAASLADGSFGEGGTGDDVVVTGATSASATAYARTAEGTTAKGFDVAASGIRSLFLNFRAPTANTISAQQSMTVTVTAAAG